MSKKVLIGIAVVVVLVAFIYFISKGTNEEEPTVRIGYLNIVASLPSVS